jgi:transcriptional regulator with XRE-family HTH domain
LTEAVKNRVAELVAQKSRREGRKITQDDIFTETGLGRSTIYEWMANKVTRFDGKVLMAWCDYLNCGISDILVREEVVNPEHPEQKAYYMEASPFPV